MIPALVKELEWIVWSYLSPSELRRWNSPGIRKYLDYRFSDSWHCLDIAVDDNRWEYNINPEQLTERDCNPWDQPLLMFRHSNHWVRLLKTPRRLVVEDGFHPRTSAGEILCSSDFRGFGLFNEDGQRGILVDVEGRRTLSYFWDEKLRSWCWQTKDFVEARQQELFSLYTPAIGTGSFLALRHKSLSTDWIISHCSPCGELLTYSKLRLKPEDELLDIGPDLTEKGQYYLLARTRRDKKIHLYQHFKVGESFLEASYRKVSVVGDR